MTEAFEMPPETGEGYEPLGAAKPVERSDRSVRLKSGTATVEVTALAPDLFRVGMFPEGHPPEYGSYAVEKNDWEPVKAGIEETEGSITLSTEAGAARLSLDPLRIGFADASGNIFAADNEKLGMGVGKRSESLLGPPVRMYKRREAGERFFGCGERTSGLEKTGSHQIFWNVDPPLGHTASLNNLYSSIPFVLSLKDGRAYGLLFDNTHRSEFDLAKERPDVAYYGAEGGNLVYYVFCGPTPREVLARYTELTGHTPMPPLWALGYQQSRWSYGSEKRLKDVACEFRERDIPCDVLYLDIDYMDGFRVFTWNRESFTQPGKTVSELREQGFRVVTIVDPGVKVDENYPIYTEGRDRGFFCQTREGTEYRNAVWPGICAFPDFMDPKVREWWGENHRVLLDEGVAGIWCDMNEPSLNIPKQSTMPPDVVHPGGGDPVYHGEIHNVYGTLMARAAREGLLKHRPDERPFVITRSGYAGVQRHAMQWTGDNSSWWEHLWMSMPQLQNMGLSGVAWAGVDIGGFGGDCDGELLARFTEFGVFQPFCRNHSAKDTRHQEPWAFGEPYESVCREMIKLRYRLLPYLYTLFEECHRTGAPILRPLLFEYPADEATYATDDEFLLGNSLLIAPITRPGIEHRHVYLPEGTWLHYWSGERFEGPAHILAHAPLGEPAIYVRSNHAIPLGPEVNHTGERPADPITFLLYPSEGAGESELYEDAGEGFGYEEGEYARRNISCERSGDGVTVGIGAREGDFVPDRRSVLVELRGLDFQPQGVSVNGADADRRTENGDLVIPLEETPAALMVEVRP